MFDWMRPELARLLSQKQRLSHALLFVGPRGIGKQALGLALAQGLLCESPDADDMACGQCRACHWFAVDTHPDFRKIEPLAESGADEDKDRPVKSTPWITVEQIRELHAFAAVSGHRGGRKIILITPAEALNASAANALLKNLEEPPPQTHFILLSHRPHRLPRTLVSRCRQLELRAPDRETTLTWLRSQGVNDPEVALAQASGAPLLALDMSGGDELSLRKDFLSRIVSDQFDPLAVAETFRDLPIASSINWLQKWTYDIAAQHMLGQIRYNPDLGRELARIARQVEPLPVLRLHRRLVREQRLVDHPLNGRMYLESLLLAYAALVNPQTMPARS